MSVTTGTEVFGRALDGFEGVLRGCTDSDWASLSPCDPWTALDVAGHVIGGVRWAAALINGSALLDSIRQEGFSNPGAVAGPAPVAAWLSARSELDRAVETVGTEQVLSWPFGEQTVDTGLEWFSLEVLVHTWDLAGARGSAVRLEPDLVHEHLVRLRPIGRFLRGPGVYGPELDAPPGADEQDQLLAFLGRRVVALEG
jgi:uncharacterized protein (TIGR03086 family)